MRPSFHDLHRQVTRPLRFGGAAHPAGQAPACPQVPARKGPQRLAGPGGREAPSRSDADGALDLGGAAPHPAQRPRTDPQKQQKCRSTAPRVALVSWPQAVPLKADGVGHLLGWAASNQRPGDRVRVGAEQAVCLCPAARTPGKCRDSPEEDVSGARPGASFRVRAGGALGGDVAPPVRLTLSQRPPPGTGSGNDKT